MQCELVYAGGDHVLVPPQMGQPRHDQMHGTHAEQLVEVAGRVCYDSMGTEKSRNSRDYHTHLLESKHLSVYEHVHFTIEVKDMEPMFWMGIPDVTVRYVRDGQHGCAVRLTANIRHAIEWPDNITFVHEWGGGEETIERWTNILQYVRSQLMPNVFPYVKPCKPVDLCKPQRDTEAFVSLFLEDSRVWSHEMVRHRHNMSQRSGRFVDETDRDYSIHPLFKEYLNECGYLAINQHDGAKLFCDTALPDNEVAKRTRLGNHVGSLIAQSKVTYDGIVTTLQEWLVQSRGMDMFTARKQARSAARYYLGNGLSTEMLYTASIKGWRDIFTKRCNPAADAAINELMEAAKAAVWSSRYGHLL